MALPRIGLWSFQFDGLPWSEGREVAQELESLGYGALWFPEAMGRDAMVACAIALEATERLVLATGIVPLYARDPLTRKAGWHTLEAAYPERFLLGIGVSHKPAVEGMRGATYTAPIATMREYLDRLDAAPFFARPPATAPGTASTSRP